MGGNEPFAEQYRIAALTHANLEAAADILEQTKSAVKSQRMLELGPVAVNRAELVVVASPEWQAHLYKIADARRAANLAKVEKEYLRMKFSEWISLDADKRVEAKL